MLETEITKLTASIDRLCWLIENVAPSMAQKSIPLPTTADNDTPTAEEKEPNSSETIPTSAELQTLCAALVRKDSEWRTVIKEHLGARNAAKVADLTDADKCWFRDWMTKELG